MQARSKTSVIVRELVVLWQFSVAGGRRGRYLEAMKRPWSSLPPITALPLALLVCVLAVSAYWGGLAQALTAAAIAAIGFAVGLAAKTDGVASPVNDAADRLKDQQQDVGASLAALIEAVEQPVLLLNGQMTVKAHNRGARDIYPQLRIGTALTVAARNPGLLQAVEDVSTTGEARTLEILDHFPHGRRLLLTVSPVRAFDGGRLLFLQFRDLSAQDRLAQMRSDFIANASHELRTPLASLKGFIETLRGPARNDEKSRERFLAIMDAQAARMARILDDLLSLSRIEMQAHLAPETNVDVKPIVTSVVRSLEPLAGEAKAALRVTTGIDAAVVRGNRDELEQVFQNLIHNAIKYGREGGTVEITMRRRSGNGSARDCIAVSVMDDGPGIASEHLPRLTERFYRVDTATSRERGGTGLGLAIVKHILTRHRGELEIASKLGEGSTFTVVLDLIAEPQTANIGVESQMG